MSRTGGVWSTQFAVFVGVGAACAVLDVGLMQGLVRAGVGPMLAASSGFAAGLALNFTLHTRVTFAHRRPQVVDVSAPVAEREPVAGADACAAPADDRGRGGSKLAMIRFSVVVAMNYGLTLACVAASVAAWGDALPGKLLSLPAVAVNGFLWSKHWVFR